MFLNLKIIKMNTRENEKKQRNKKKMSKNLFSNHYKNIQRVLSI